MTYRVAVDAEHRTVPFNRAGDKSWEARLVFERTTPDRLALDGTMDERQVRLKLQLFDEKKFLLLSPGFHWIQEFPFNR